MKINSSLFVLAVITFFVFACNSGDTNPGDSLFAAKKYNEAITAYSEELGSKPNDVKSLYNRGRAYQELGKIDEAEKDFEGVIAIDEKNVNAHLSLAKLYYGKELYNKAVLMAEKAIEINENSAQGHFLAARSKHQLGYIDGAMESYTLAVKIDPNFGEAYLYRGALKLHSNKTMKACEDFQKAKALDVAEADNILTKYCK